MFFFNTNIFFYIRVEYPLGCWGKFDNAINTKNTITEFDNFGIPDYE